MRKDQPDRQRLLIESGELVPLLRKIRGEIPGRDRDDWHRFVSEEWICDGLAKIRECPAGDLREHLDRNSIAALLRHAILSKSARLIRENIVLWQTFGANCSSCERLADAIESFLEPGAWSSAGEPAERVIDLRYGIPSIAFSTALTGLHSTLLSLNYKEQSGLLSDAIPSELIGSGTTSVKFPMVDLGNQKIAEGLSRDFGISLQSDLDLSSSSEGLLTEAEKTWHRLLDSQYWCLESGKKYRFKTPKVVKALKDCHESHKSREKCDFSPLTLPRLPSWLSSYPTTFESNSSPFESAGLAVAIYGSLRGNKALSGLSFSGAWNSNQLGPVKDLNRKMIAARNSGCVLFFACVDLNEWNHLLPPPGLRLVALPAGRELDEVFSLINFACGATGFTDFYAKCRAGAIENPLIRKASEISLPVTKDRYPVGFVGREYDVIELKHRLQLEQAGAVAVVAPARAGKTSLLMQVVEEVSPPPAWFSIDRIIPRSRYCTLLMKSLHLQICDRYETLRATSIASSEVDRRPNIAGRISIVVDGLDEAANMEEAATIIEKLRDKFPEDRILLGSQPGVLACIDKYVPRSFPLFDDEWSTTEHSIQDAIELIKRYQHRFREKAFPEAAEKAADEQYARKVAERAGGGLGHLTEYFEAVCRGVEELPDDSSRLPVFSDDPSYIKDLLRRVFEPYEGANRARIECFTATLAYLRGKKEWRILDVVQLGGLDDPSRFGEWTTNGLLSNGIGRIIEFNHTHVQFCSPHTAQAVRTYYQVDFPAIASRMFAQIQSPSNVEMAAFLVDNIAGLIAEFGTPSLGDQLLATAWPRVRFESLVLSSDSVRLLADEMRTVPKIEKSEQARALSDWIARWTREIDQTSEVRSSWLQYEPSGLMRRVAAIGPVVPIYFQPHIASTGISLNPGDNTDVDCVRLRIDGAFNNGTVSVCAAYVFDSIYPDTTGHRHIAIDGSVTSVGKRFWTYVAADNLECRLHGQRCILETRSAPTHDWSQLDLAKLLGLASQSEHNQKLASVECEEIDWDALETHEALDSDAESLSVLELQDAVITSSTIVVCTGRIQTGEQTQRCIVLVELHHVQSPRVELIELGGEHGGLTCGMGDLLVFEERRDEDSYPVGEYVVEATTGDFFPTEGTFPSLQLVSITRHRVVILVNATDEGCSGAYLHASGIMPPRYLPDTTHLSNHTFVTDLGDDRLTLVSIRYAETSWTIQSSVLQLSTGILVSQPSEDWQINIRGWVEACCVSEELMFVALRSGRIEVRSCRYPYQIRALAFVAVSFEGESDAWVRITDLKASRTSNGFWLWVATDQLNRFDLSELVKAEGAS